MDNVYYLTHPRVGKTAVVYAPTTEKARTTFLDWLERNDIIGRAHRHFYRKDMIAERIEDPNVPTDVVLNYGYEDFSGRFEFERPEVHDIPVRLEEPEVEDIPIEDDLDQAVREQDEFVRQYEGGGEPPKSGKMPIQQVMLRGYKTN